MSKDKPYLPKVRTCYSPSETKIRSYSENGDSTSLPNPAVDDIVVNNIAWQEFDYTESLANANESIISEVGNNPVQKSYTNKHKK